MGYFMDPSYMLFNILAMVLSVGGRIGNTDRHLKNLEDAINKTKVKKRY